GRTVKEWSLAPRTAPFPEGDVAERLTSPLGNPRFQGSLVWNSDDAESDGFYVFRSSVEDAAGNTRELPPIEILVDTTPPELVRLSDHAEGPDQRTAADRDREQSEASDEDARREIVLGENDQYRFRFLLRDADAVEAYILDEAGRSLFPLNPEITSYADEDGFYRGLVTWRGLAPDGVPLPEGVYRVNVVASDILGNTATIEGSPILLRRRVPRFSLELSDRYVAPNDDGYRDEIVIEPALEPLLGLREWRISVVDLESKRTTASWSGIDLPPERLRAGASAFPRDGSYRIEGRAEYEAGVDVEVTSREIVADRTPPVVEFALSPQRVRPEQGREVTLFFEDDGTVAESRVLVSSPSGGRESFTLATFEGIPDRYTWYLAGPEGELLQPGIYRVLLEAQDETGNTTISEYRDVVLQERLGGVSAVPVVDLFSPNGDGLLDDAVLALDGPAGADGTFRIEVSDRTGTVHRSFGGTLPLPEQIAWDGNDDTGRPVEDGTYLLRVVVEVPDLPPLRSEAVGVTVDTTPPEGTVRITGSSVVSPDGDGVQDELNLEIDYSDRFGGDVEAVARAIRRRDDGTEESVPVSEPEGRGEEITWSPTARDGTPLPDGRYTIALELTDEATNTTILESDPFTVDTRPVSGFVRLDRGYVNPGEEGAVLEITPVLSDPMGVTRWAVSVEPTFAEDAVFEQSGELSWSPEPIVWRPDTDIPDGRYRVRFAARYAHGPVVERYSPEFIVDATAPTATVAVEPSPFSPDGDGVDDILSVSFDVEDTSPLGYWYFEILDPRGTLFYDTGGEGSPPPALRWDGRARNGDTVFSAETYSWRFESADVLGNTVVREGDIPIDILLEPYEGGYRIQIPSITFPPNSAELLRAGTELAARQNRSVLSRLSEILRRYPDYHVLVEGHAVNVSGTQREQEEELVPLSRARAAAVRDALIEEGIPASRLGVRGQGGRYPIVPHDDLEMRWKNRRVDFILRKER
ncbi:MAG: OmpA family protein, partial [Alkalispirochaeta sp.]